jgi:hypothetical protein
MNILWTKDHTEPRGKAKRLEEIKGYTTAFQEASSLIEKHILKEVKPDFTVPGWEGDVAYQHGQRDAILRILKFLDIKD